MKMEDDSTPTLVNVSDSGEEAIKSKIPVLVTANHDMSETLKMFNVMQ